jgi:glycosyltransferase involved in cell wall biosynthesis
MTPKVTICLPTYNSESTIEETLDSLAKQSFKDFDLVVFDNASADKTLEIVSSYKDQFRSLKIEKAEHNLGAEANFTRCIQYTDEGFMAIYHADDIYHPRIIEEQVNAMKEDDIIAVSTRAIRIDYQGAALGKRFIPPELESTPLSKLLFDDLLELIFKYGNFVVCPSVMAKSSVMKNDIRNWNGTDFKTSADLDVWLRLSKVGKFGFLSEPLMSYREADASTSFRMRQVRTYRHDLFKVLDYYFSQASVLSHNFYEFLENKDLALRVYNGLKDPVEVRKFQPCKLSFMKLGVKSSFHRNFLIKMILIWLFSRFKFLFT